MTSLLFWGPYLAHKGVVSHKREKQRVKNYQRWEGLRDEYDDQRRVTRETRSLDIQRTGVWDPVTQQMTGTIPPHQASFDDSYNDHGMVTQRDQQEANDARTSWRPQETWESPRTQLQAQMTGQIQNIPQLPQQHTQYPQQHYTAQRHVSSTPTMQSIPTSNPNLTPLPVRSQKTGATWDEGLPAPLQVSRRSFDDYDHNISNSTSHSTRWHSPPTSTPHSLIPSKEPSRTHTPSGLRETSTPPTIPSQEYSNNPFQRDLSSTNTNNDVLELPKNEFGFVESNPPRTSISASAGASMNGEFNYSGTAAPGGRMAELIERGY